jgi:hypothetical protein
MEEKERTKLTYYTTSLALCSYFILNSQSMHEKKRRTNNKRKEMHRMFRSCSYGLVYG